MHIPERPQTVLGLDLLERLSAYSKGAATWRSDKAPLGSREQAACAELHANLTAVVQRCLHPLMDRVTAREMQGFTMHDHGHGLKVAHLMWHITSSERREHFSPAEIAMLVLSAHLHDLGMGLSPEERAARLHPNSDLWEKVEPSSAFSESLKALAALARQDGVSDAVRAEAAFQVQQAQEALLCTDTRERHATKERYQELLDDLHEMHRLDPTRVPDVYSLLNFDGDSFVEKLVDVCVSHNEDAHVLLDRDPSNSDQWRFPTQYPVGSCVADTRFVAAALRLADILDFDRERTPSVLYHYLLPRSADPFENISIREWSKHLAISSWDIERGQITFRGRSPSALVHHTIVEFCHTIEDEIARTRSLFGPANWQFSIEPKVEPVIETAGYRYIPYRFSLDEERIYALLMGKHIYAHRLDALRELIQNAVDACKLRDSLMHCYEHSVRPEKHHRITVRYETSTSTGNLPRLSIVDSGIGMDRYVIENYFLRVGRSYYKSADFLRTRSILRREGVDFRPVSEFGVGFLAVFMLGDRVEVETAPWYPPADDNQRRTLRIDGLGRLIEVSEAPNARAPRLHGTRVTVKLSSTTHGAPPSWHEVVSYLRDVCRNLDYPLLLEHISPAGTEHSELLPEGLQVPIPDHLRDAALVIPVDDQAHGLLGQIVLFRAREGRDAEATLATQSLIRPINDGQAQHYHESGKLLRGGFLVGSVPGLPHYVLSPSADARIEVIRDPESPRSLPLTNLARSSLLNSKSVSTAVFRIWLEFALNALDEIEARPIGAPDIDVSLLRAARWLESNNAYQLYRLAKTSWISAFRNYDKAKDAVAAWETGEGPELWIGWSNNRSLHWQIFSLIMPRVAKLVVAKLGYFYLTPPRQGWRDEFMTWNTFISDNQDWGDFADYERNIANILYDDYSGPSFLNVRFKDLFTGFTMEDLARLKVIFHSLMYAREYQRQASILSSDLPLLERAVKVAGDLEIRHLHNSSKLGALARGTYDHGADGT